MSEQLLAYAKRVKELNLIKEEQIEALSITNKELEDLTRDKIPNLMAELEIKKITFDGVGRIQLAADIFMSTKEGMKDQAIQWLRDCGYEGMIQNTYNASTLKALFRQMLRDGSEPPTEIFSVTPFTRASLVKA